MMTRRIFLKNGSLALVSLGFAPVFIARAAQAAQARKKVLVAIFQRGAVDGLNMVVPFGDREYYKAGRRSRSRSRASAMATKRAPSISTGSSGCNPRMASLAPLFQSGELAIVHACGSHDRRRGRTSTRRTTWRAARRA